MIGLPPGKSVAEGRAFIQDALDQFHNPTFTTVRCTAEFLLLRGQPVITALQKLQTSADGYTTNKKGSSCYRLSQN